MLVVVAAAVCDSARAGLVLMHPAAADSAVDFIHAQATHGEPASRAIARLLLYHPPFDGALVAQAVVARYFVARAATAVAMRRSATRASTTCDLYGAAAADAILRLRAHHHAIALAPAFAKARHGPLAARFRGECVARGVDPDVYAAADARTMYRLFETVVALAPATVG